MTLSLALASAALSACTATPSQEPPEPALVVRGGANPSSLFEVARDYAAHLGKPLVVSDRDRVDAQASRGRPAGGRRVADLRGG